MTGGPSAPGEPAQRALERVLKRLRITLAGISGELAGGMRITADLRSLARFSLDVLGYRAQRIVPIGRSGRWRSVRLKDDVEFTYRLNRGDVRALAEVWLARAYELPFAAPGGNVIDLGANIGATSVWLWRRYAGTRLVAVEPVPENARLLRQNLERNHVTGEVVEAAVGPRTATARFELSPNSTWGRISTTGIEVDVVTPQSLVDRFPPQERVHLLKVDVEGAEQELFDGDLEWLDRVDSLVVELHTDRVDWRAIVEHLEAAGFASTPLAHANPYSGVSDLTYAFWRPV